MKYTVDDDFLYAHMGNAEKAMLSAILDKGQLDHTFSNRFSRKMNKLMKYERRTPFMRSAVRYSKTAAAVFLVALIIAFTTTMSVEACRVRLFEFVTTVWDEFTSIIVESEDAAEDDKLIPAQSTYIPTGYTEINRTVGIYENNIVYANTEGDEITYIQTLLTQGETIFDTENAEVSEMQLGPQTVHVINKYGTATLYWNDAMHFYVITGTAEETELVAMAKNIIEKN